ncbi:hypothetical protein BSKO_04259 [Bryopsis sp. KO-2023]|nr:hypothetical protein BSKO_04259 [Bryopsis sp. KO-2023]
MGSRGISLGVAGDMVGEGDPITHHVTKCGGSPWYPGQQSERSPTCPKCDICKQDLALLLQAYAPLPSSKACSNFPERSLYLFGCVAQGCGKKPGSWKAIRAQLPPVVPERSDIDSTKQGPARSSPAEQSRGAASPIGSGRGGFAPHGQTVGNERKEESTSPFDFPDLDVALSSLGDPSSKSFKKKKASKRGDEKGGTGSSKENAVQSSHMMSQTSTLPQFLIWSKPEPREGSKVQMSDKEKNHVDDLLSRYEATEGSMESGLEKDEMGQRKSKARQVWDAEKYESTFAVWKPFRAFQKRMGRSPDQCVRYGFGGEFLCPKVIAGKVPPCQACGSVRIFEMQTMPPLLTYLAEASAWTGQEGNTSTVKTTEVALDCWDWISIAVFSCEKSCSTSREGPTFVEECVCLYSED